MIKRFEELLVWICHLGLMSCVISSLGDDGGNTVGWSHPLIAYSQHLLLPKSLKLVSHPC